MVFGIRRLVNWVLGPCWYELYLTRIRCNIGIYAMISFLPGPIILPQTTLMSRLVVGAGHAGCKFWVNVKEFNVSCQNRDIP